MHPICFCLFSYMFIVFVNRLLVLRPCFDKRLCVREITSRFTIALRSFKVKNKNRLTEI